MPSVADFCTVEKAVSLTGATEWEVRSWIRQILLYGSTAEQQLVEQRDGHWHIALPLLHRLAEQHRPQGSTTGPPQRPIEAGPPAGSNKYFDILLDALQGQLKVKDQQIDALHGKLDSILERMRELNVIVNELQKQRVVVHSGAEGVGKSRKKKKPSAAEPEPDYRPETQPELPAPGPAYRSFREWVRMMGGQAP